MKIEGGCHCGAVRFEARIETGAEASPNIRDAQACQRVLDAIKTASATQSVVNLA